MAVIHMTHHLNEPKIVSHDEIDPLNFDPLVVHVLEQINHQNNEAAHDLYHEEQLIQHTFV